MKHANKIASAFALSTLVMVPICVFAQNNTPIDYELLVPLPGLTTIQGMTGLPQYLNAMFRLGVAVAGLLAVVMIVICGIKLMTSEVVSSKSEAKQCIYNAIFGIILVLASWLILNTLNPDLLRNDLNVSSQISTTGATQQQAGSGAINEQPPTVAGWYFHYRDVNNNTRYSQRSDNLEACAKMANAFETAGPVMLMTNGNACFEVQRNLSAQQIQQVADEDTARRQLCNNFQCVNTQTQTFNPAVNKGGCPTDTATNCTRIAYLPQAAIGFIRNLVGACGGCQIMVTGGTESGHATHGKNQAVFDLRYLYNDGLDTLIRQNGQDGHGNVVPSGIPSCSGAGFCSNRRWFYNGYWFIDEISATQKGGIRHWHVCQDGQTNSSGTAYPYCTRPANPFVQPNAGR